MARNSKAVVLDLQTLNWDSVIYAGGGGGFGGGPPSKTPYLWTIFFLIDGSNVSLNAGGTLSGAAQIFTTPGSHGDLGKTSIHVGQSLPIDSVLGWWTSAVLPIPVDPSLQSTVGDDLPGFFGAVAVAMDWEHVTDSGAEAGHQALNAYVTTAIDEIVASIGPTHQMVTQSDIDSVTAGAGAAVSSAIQNAQSGWDNFVSWLLGPDQQIGHYTWLFNQDMFPDASDHQDINQAISAETDALGGWSIHGTLDVTDRCAAGTTFSLIRKGSSTPEEIRRAQEGLDAMRAFRDRGGLRSIPTAAWWWDRASTHSAELAKLLLKEPALKGPFSTLLGEVGSVLMAPDRPIPNDVLDQLQKVLAALAHLGSPSLARDARRVTRMIPEIRGKSLHAAESVFARNRQPRATKRAP